MLLGILITVHEFGHFIAARMVGIDVMEFAIGFGPKLVGWKGKKGTDFSIRLIPMGGYCAFFGEDDAEGKHVDDPRSYNRQNVWKRMFTVLMGPMMNFVLAFVVVVAFYFIGGMTEITGYEPFISEVAGTGPAYNAGLKDGDVVESVNGVYVLDGTTETLLNAIAGYQEGDAPLQMVVRRGESTFTTEMTPFWDAELERFRVGVTIGARALTVTRPCSFGEAVREGWNWCVYAGGVIVTSLKNLVTTGEGLDQTAGPVGVVTMVSQEVQQYGFEAFINLLVVISINLGIMNLLPIPGLDGSRFLFNVVEAVRGKPIPAQKEAIIHLCGYMLLIGLMIFFTFKDVMRLFQ